MTPSTSLSILLLLAALPVLGCTTPAEEPPADAAEPDALADAPAPEGLPAAPGTWTFVPIDGMRCADGSATGIGVRLEPESKELMLYLQGGGACTTGETCWVSKNAAHVDGYGPTEFAQDGLLENYALLDPSATSGNPFADMTMVMVPYCTGDAHSGRAIRDLDVRGTPKTTYFVGAINMDLVLRRLAAAFPSLERVWLVGTSAGGGGATFNYGRIAGALRVPVHSIIDSAPGFYTPGDEQKWQTWGVEPACAGCDTVAEVRAYNRQLAPATRYGFLSFAFDPTTADGRSPADFTRDLGELLATVQADPNGRTFVADNSSYDCSKLPRGSCHVVTTKNRPASLRAAYLAWLRAMVAGSGWNNVTAPL